MQNTEHSNQAALEAALEAVANHSIASSEYPKWVEITICAEVSSEEDYDEVFAWAAGEQGGPICPGSHQVPCWECAEALEHSTACDSCGGTGELARCAREHYAASQVMTNGMSTWEWELRGRLESVLAVLEAGDAERAKELLAAEIEGFEPLLGAD
jgi:hypothetical protein